MIIRQVRIRGGGEKYYEGKADKVIKDKVLRKRTTERKFKIKVIRESQQ
jgi:hypothetical protein